MNCIYMNIKEVWPFYLDSSGLPSLFSYLDMANFIFLVLSLLCTCGPLAWVSVHHMKQNHGAQKSTLGAQGLDNCSFVWALAAEPGSPGRVVSEPLSLLHLAVFA